MNNANPISPKVTAASAATAAATVLWILLSLWGPIKALGPVVIGTLTAATATVFAFGLGYIVKDENREQGKGVPVG